MIGYITIPKTNVKFVNYGINPYLWKSDSYLSGEATFGYKYAENSNADDMTANAVYKYNLKNLP